ncbi:NAD-dependent epimerase/dehydratase family protein [Ferdinandcohnia quinoae]|uniref:NAD-dependent epimerase/dehydratase family protein n=1 Tax=Fredinandcohnia quinoae TaxID=2918902 RepID=A0AAW5E3J5_9BACI|nr:NAD-dependent epimerase/dehydratase family protein [Fredinandcohnia sp. SECRCQ15]MCH1624472.1 NAD-dependent epimerase/dehydratase family protein [Fredinandcohnia sp. SECRCQ15]
MQTIEQLEDILTTPSAELIEDLKKIEGDILILGVGGKMGPTLAKLIHRGINKAGLSKKVIGVSRFSSGHLQEELNEFGVETIAADLLKDDELHKLPNVKNVIYMAGTKFGTTGNEHFTWAMNSYLSGRVAEKFASSRIVVFSTGNVYPLTNVLNGTCTEERAVSPIGEYAQSCLGRERIFTHFSHENGTPIVIYRLNYAIDLRYGVLHELAKQVYDEKTIDLRMGHFNVIWQGDANEYAVRSLLHCDSPPQIINVTGPETISSRWIAEEFAKRFDKKAYFINEEEPTALLNNAAKAHQLFGYPKVTLRQMIDWTAEWIKNDGATLNKPTHFQEREGAF